MDGTGVLQVGLLALATAIATGFGALPFAFGRGFSAVWLGSANAIAAGLMLAASFGLIYEGLDHGLTGVVVGMVVGLAVIVLANTRLHRGDGTEGEETGVAAFAGMGALDARKALVIVAIMTIHSFTEGVAVGVAFGGGRELGLFIALAIAVHNIPEGLAISLVLVPRGLGWARAAGWSVFSSLPQPLMAVPAFLFVDWFRPLLPYGLGFAAGAMIWLVFSELLPDALEDATGNLVGVVVTLSIAAMVTFQVLVQ